MGAAVAGGVTFDYFLSDKAPIMLILGLGYRVL